MNAPELPPAKPDVERAELASLRQLQRAVRQAFEAEPGPSPRAKVAVLQRIHAADSGTRASWLEQFAAWLRAPLVPRWASAAALLLIVIQGAALVRMMPSRTNSSTAVTTRAVATNATRLRVVFNPLASAAQVRELLDSLGARIVDGPAPTGGYVIELTAADPRSLSKKLSVARARRDVLLTIDLAPP